MLKPHIVLIGDRVLASRYVGYARQQFEIQVRKQHGNNFATAMQPREDVYVEMQQFGEFKKVIITAQPPIGAKFVYDAADAQHYGGWGAPYLAPSPENSSEQDVTTKGIPYGEEFSNESKPLIVGADARYPVWAPKRYPQYKTQYPDLKYGTMDWISSDRRNSISWDGLNSRHRYVVPNEDDIFHGYFDGTCDNDLNEGLMFIGQVFNKNPLCTYPDQPFKEGLYRITGVGENSAQSLADYEYKFALSSNVYKGGKVLWADEKNRFVTGAALVFRKDAEGSFRELRAILCDYDMNRGGYNDYLVRYNLTRDETITDIKLESYNNENVPITDFHRGMLWPWANVNVATFRGDGRRVLLLRDYFELGDTGRWYANTKLHEYTLEADPQTEGSAADLNPTSGFGLGGISLSNGENEPFIKDLIWDNRTSEGAPKIDRIDNNDELPTNTYSKAWLRGDFMVAADYIGKEKVYAWINTLQTDEVTQTLVEGTCDNYNLVQNNEVYEYLWFSQQPLRQILLKDTYITRDTKIYTPDDPDYKYRKTYLRFSVAELCAVDARHSAALLNMVVSNSWWEYRTSNNAEVEVLDKYEPADNITQDWTVRAYLNGDEIYTSETERTVISYSWTSTTERQFYCDQDIESISLYEKGDVGYPESDAQPVMHEHGQIVARKISPTTVDIMYGFRVNSYQYPTMTLLLRYDTLKEVIIKQTKVDEISEIGDFFNTETTVAGADTGGSDGYIGNIGLL